MATGAVVNIGFNIPERFRPGLVKLATAENDVFEQLLDSLENCPPTLHNEEMASFAAKQHSIELSYALEVLQAVLSLYSLQEDGYFSTEQLVQQVSKALQEQSEKLGLSTNEIVRFQQRLSSFFSRPQKQRSYKNSRLLDKLHRMYTLSNSSKLLSFFDENQYLISVVTEAYKEFKKRFPSEEIILEVVSDPETDGYEELFAYIQTSLPVEDAFQKLNDLDEEWFLNQLDRTNGLFNFNLRFV